MERANPFGGLNDFAPKTPKSAAKPVEQQQIDLLAEANGFPSRPTGTKAVSPPEIPPTATTPARRRYTTGRNQQINVKAKADTIARFYALADLKNAPLGEILDQALIALEKAEKTSTDGS